MTVGVACADFTFPLLNHDQALQLIAMLGFDGVDIGLFEGRSHLWPSQAFADTAVAARRLREKLTTLHLAPADLFLQMDPDFTPFAFNHPLTERRQKARSWFQHALDFAAELGCKHLTTLPGVHFEQESYADSFARAVAELSWRVEQAKLQDIIFAIEAHVGSIVFEPQAAERLIRQVPGLTLTLDYTHFTRLGLPDEAVEPLLPYASHFHIRGARKNRLQASFSDNIIDYNQILSTLQANNYQGWLGIEYVWIDWEHCNECDNLSETILFRDFLLERLQQE